jgi:hypothetical protein
MCLFNLSFFRSNAGVAELNGTVSFLSGTGNGVFQKMPCVRPLHEPQCITVLHELQYIRILQ